MRARVREINAANQHASYIRGWIDGAKISALRPEFMERDKGELLRLAYELGYSDGRAAQSSASHHATDLYGHEPEILRLQGEGAE